MNLFLWTICIWYVCMSYIFIFPALFYHLMRLYYLKLKDMEMSIKFVLFRFLFRVALIFIPWLYVFSFMLLIDFLFKGE